ncbi:DUF167 family protein [Aminobacter anthyllidis]|uniref:DUF167 family protein n=1 Tax=Aminobacter anthyllidis TaxID=1035067 RepID=UPI002455E460|nr:DUF167 family protein [Aminobacter anthyllidis]MDH4987410.1 DUF167 family protein [Aminobacter anthyllidis]
MSGCFRLREDGVDLFVRLTPKSSKDAVEGVEQTADGRCHFAARVRAVPEKGEANAALEKLLADEFGIPRKSIKVIAGGTSRLKTVRITGNASELARLMAEFARR